MAPTEVSASAARRAERNALSGRRLEALRREFDEGFRRAPHEDRRELQECLIVMLAGEAYAYPLIHVLELLAVPPIMPVPDLPAAVLGIINFRGQILSVSVVHGLLGLSPSEPGPDSRILVTKDLTLVTGILVDGVHEIAAVASDDIEPLPETVGSEKARLLAGQFYVGGRVVFLLDLEAACRSGHLAVGEISS